VERAIGYARQNFWPLREFTDLHDVNRQARQRLSEIANQRQHRETRERPIDRFKAATLRPLPHRFAGRRLTLKADSSSVTIYDRVNEIVSYPRRWRRGQTLGAERFEAELADLRPAAKRSRAQQRLFAVLDGLCPHAVLETYLRDIADTDGAHSRQPAELLEFIRQYGPV
jgi:hypothetical protein